MPHPRGKTIDIHVSMTCRSSQIIINSNVRSLWATAGKRLQTNSLALGPSACPLEDLFSVVLFLGSFPCFRILPPWEKGGSPFSLPGGQGQDKMDAGSLFLSHPHLWGWWPGGVRCEIRILSLSRPFHPALSVFRVTYTCSMCLSIHVDQKEGVATSGNVFCGPCW